MKCNTFIKCWKCVTFINHYSRTACQIVCWLYWRWPRWEDQNHRAPVLTGWVLSPGNVLKLIETREKTDPFPTLVTGQSKTPTLGSTTLKCIEILYKIVNGFTNKR